MTQPLSLRPTPRPENKGGDRKRAQETKVTGARLEGFMDWEGIISSKPAEEEEMFKLAIGFAARMSKRAADSEGESTPITDGKRPKRSSPDEEAQEDWAIILVEIPPIKPPTISRS